jgi:hypothetical protein
MLHPVAQLQEKHDRYVTRVPANEFDSGLEGPIGFAVCTSNDDETRPVLLFWSDRAYASRAKQAGYQDHEPRELSLFDFLFRWLPGMKGDKALAGTNFNADFAGLETEPLDLQEQLLSAMKPELARAYIDRLKAAVRPAE